MDSLALTFSSGWASGVNAYLVVLVLGLGRRVGGVDDVPDVLARWDVLALAGFLYAIEFVADKIPYVDSTWDAISTVVRPMAGGVIGLLLAGDADTLTQAVNASVGGGTALLSHAVKAGGRLAINSSPEPVTNVAASVVEDVVVLALVAFALQHPVAAASAAAVLLVVGLGVLYLALRAVRRGWRRMRERRAERPPASAAAPPSGPPWT